MVLLALFVGYAASFMALALAALQSGTDPSGLAPWAGFGLAGSVIGYLFLNLTKEAQANRVEQAANRKEMASCTRSVDRLSRAIAMNFLFQAQILEGQDKSLSGAAARQQKMLLEEEIKAEEVRRTNGGG
jgi:uncharacterized membrane protein